MTMEAVRATETEYRLSPADELARIPLYEKGKPPQPLFDIDYLDELEATWGRRWGAQTELGRLRYVMVQKPTSGAVNSPVVAEDPAFFGWPKGRPDLAAMTKNYESLVAILKREGVEVVSLNAPESVRGTYTEMIALDAPREPVILNGGALIGRTGIASKRGLEKVHAQRLMELGCPILSSTAKARCSSQAMLSGSMRNTSSSGVGCVPAGRRSRKLSPFSAWPGSRKSMSPTYPGTSTTGPSVPAGRRLLPSRHGVQHGR